MCCLVDVFIEFFLVCNGRTRCSLILSPLSRTWVFVLSVVLTASFPFSASSFRAAECPTRYRRPASDFSFSSQCPSSSAPRTRAGPSAFLRHILCLLPHFWCPFLLAMACTRRSGVAKHFLAIHDGVPPSRNRPTFATLSRHATVSARVGRGCSSPTGHSVCCPAIPAVPATDGKLSLKILSSNSSVVSSSHPFSQGSCRSS